MSGPRALAVILAAGESRRMGIPKALLDCRGRSFLSTLASAFGEAGCEVLAVVGAGAAEIESHHLGLSFVRNPRWREGQLSSARAGIAAALERGAGSVLLQPVDAPLLQPATIRAVLEALAAAEAAFPVHRARPGHPLGLTRAAAERVISMEDAPDLQAAAARLGAIGVPCEDRGSVLSFNTPDEYERELGSPPRPH
ncbi:MAG: NTP transferase domain-containing protein [Myxococcales bacterium]|nr:NTP transferase domain-containing protein [Myxococcales bacterium]